MFDTSSSSLRASIVRAALLSGLVPLIACGGDADDESRMEPAAQAPPPSAIAPADSVPVGVTAEEVALGRDLFLPCAVCHGLDGRGNALGPSLRDGEWIHGRGSLEEIEAVIRTGVPSPRDHPVPMVPMGGGDFDDAELRAVASYVYAISRDRRAAP